MRIVGSLATQFAPPFSLILHFFTNAAIVQLFFPLFLLFNRSLLEEDIYSLRFASFGHFYLLGFVMMVIFGAIYQLIPVALEIPVFSFKLAYIHFYLYTSGFIFFIATLLFPEFSSLLPLSGLTLFLSFLLFFVNFFISLRKLEKFDITIIFVLTANFLLLLGIIIGLLLAINFYYGFVPFDITDLIHAHVILVIFGFISFVIFGISIVLLPMFSVSHNFKSIYIKISYIFCSVGIVSTSILYLTGFKTLSGTMFYLYIVGLIFYLFQVVEIYKHKPKRKSDFALIGMFLSHLFLPLGIFTLSIDKAAGVYTVISLFFGVLIYSTLYKIIPFLTWFHRFSNLVGKKPVPTLSSMLPEKLPKIQLILYTFGSLVFALFLILKVWFLFYLSIFFLFISAMFFIYSFIYIISYKIREGG